MNALAIIRWPAATVHARGGPPLLHGTGLGATLWGMDAIVLSIGNEIALGQTVDTNSAWLSGRLAEVGVQVVMHVTVADELAPLTREIARAAEMADLVLITGGLGPTEDDLTRQALAQAMGVDLVRSEPHLRQIEAFFAARNKPMPPANAIQADVPRGSTPIDNTCGTAPGIRAKLGRAEVFVMPGVPREMRIMYERDVLPAFVARTGGATITARTLLCFGAGESDIGTAIRDLMARGRNPTVGTTAKLGIIGVRIHAHGVSRTAAEDLLARDEAEVRRRLGDLVFGQDDETLAHAVGRLLAAREQTVSTAESCTGGLIAKQFTDVGGSSAYFMQGVVTYSNRSKTALLHVPAELIERHGAVSAEVAEAMARGCREFAATDYALSVTGIAGPGGGTTAKPVGLVFIGLSGPAGCKTQEHRFGETLSREDIRERAAAVACNLLRLKLLESKNG